jgi:hypothetical protein
MREHTACTCGDSATKAQAHPTSRNCKRYFATAPSGMHPLGSVCSGLLPCIGILNGLWRRPLARHLGSTSSIPPSAPRRLRIAPGSSRAPRAAAQRDLRWGWTGVSGWGRVAPQRCPGRTASGKATGQAGGGQCQTGSHTRSGVRHPAATRTPLLSPWALAGLRASPNKASAVFRRAIFSAYWDSLLGDPIARGLASTSRGKRRRVSREL